MTTPLMVNLKDKHCLIIGGGKVATRKVRFLLNEGAKITIISSELCNDLEKLQDNFHFIKKTIDRRDLLSFLKEISLPYFLAVIATNDFYLNQAISAILDKQIPLINIVDNQENSNFFFPAYIKRGLLKISVSTSGASPILARKIKHHLQMQFGPEYIEYLEKLKVERADTLKKFPTEKERKAYLEKNTHFPFNP